MMMHEFLPSDDTGPPPPPPPPPPVATEAAPTKSSLDELTAAVARRRKQVSAIERGDTTVADPRAAREAEMKQKKQEMLKGKASSGAPATAVPSTPGKGRIGNMFSSRSRSKDKLRGGASERDRSRGGASERERSKGASERERSRGVGSPTRTAPVPEDFSA